MSDRSRPPALARALLRLLPAEDRGEALADMAELFAARVESTDERAARRWYTVHALRLVVMLRWEQFRPSRRAAGKSGGLWTWLADFGQDARHALRTLTRNPGFAAAAIVLGRTLSFSDRTCVVVGVMPASFRYFVGAQADGWIPLGGSDARRVVARLRPGLSRDRAQQELRAALAAPEVTWKPRGVEIVPADWMRAGGVYSVNGRATRTMLYTLIGAVGLLLAIACANVANLLLARTLSREREIAVRGSLGASRWRLARQFLTEGMVLTGLGSLVAIVVAWWILEALPLAMPADLTASVFGAAWPELDMRALGFVCAAAILTGALCGAAPAIGVSRRAASAGVLGRGRRVAGLSSAERRVRAAFQALQVAMTLVLLTGAGLLLTSLLRMVIMPPGFDSRNLGYAGWTSQRSVDNTAFLDELIARALKIPGVTAATAGMPPVSGITGAQFLVEDLGAGAPVLPLEYFRVRPDYFQFAGIPLLEGRVFGLQDYEQAEPVAIVSEAAARRLWPGRSSLGRRFRQYPDAPLLTVVGVVPSVKTTTFPRDGVQAYLPAAQAGDVPSLLFRAAGDPGPILVAIRAQIRAMNPSIAVRTIDMVDNLSAEFDPMGSNSLLCDVAERLRGRWAADRRRRPLRRHLVHGQPADARDRHPPGAGRTPGAGTTAGIHRSAGAGCRRRGRRSDDQPVAVSRARIPALPGRAERSAGARGDRRGPACGLRARGRRARASRDAHRARRRAARRVVVRRRQAEWRPLFLSGGPVNHVQVGHWPIDPTGSLRLAGYQASSEAMVRRVRTP
jgi:hypothetical protein